MGFMWHGNTGVVHHEAQYVGTAHMMWCRGANMMQWGRCPQQGVPTYRNIWPAQHVIWEACQCPLAPQNSDSPVLIIVLVLSP